MTERKFAGILNSPNYFGNQNDRRFFKYVKIAQLRKYNHKYVPIARERYRSYSLGVPNLFRCDGVVYSSDRDRNKHRLVRSRIINLFPWRE